jgi:1,2-diacylglycerol 3-alpha-glucosyltransferase
MKIAIFTEILPSEFVSGVAVYIVDLIAGLLAEGHEIIVFAPKGNYKIPAELHSIRIIKIPSVPTFYPDFKISIPYTSKVVTELIKEKPDIIHLQGPSFLGIDGLVASKMLGIPCVITFHTMFTDQKYIKNITKIRWGLGTLERISWGYHRWFYNSADSIFVSTPKIKKQLADHKFKSNKIKVIPLFTNFTTGKALPLKEKESLKRKYKLKEQVALYLGRVSQEKSLDLLLEIWQKLTQKRDNVSLFIIGDGPYLKELKKLAKQLDLDRSVVFAGQIEHQKLLDSGILGVGDVFVSASTTETFGLAGLEALAHGLPAVLVDAQGLCEFIDGAGIVCQRDDPQCFQKAVEQIFDNPQLQKKMSERAFTLAKSHDKENILTKVVESYQQTISHYNEA